MRHCLPVILQWSSPQNRDLFLDDFKSMHGERQSWQAVAIFCNLVGLLEDCCTLQIPSAASRDLGAAISEGGVEISSPLWLNC